MDTRGGKGYCLRLHGDAETHSKHLVLELAEWQKGVMVRVMVRVN